MTDSLFAKETLPVNLEDEMRRSYLDYAMSVIVGRALPDVRDGLKPVHRRVLFAMHELNNDWNKPYKKSARIVGDVIGKYHPHGDVAVYDTIVRMAQDFSMRYMLVDGQGNFGSVDGDAPAAMRYTEIRMAKIAHEMLADIDKDTVDFVPNYDGSEQEPRILPTRLPALLVNGSAGIAVGMATNIPPHNLGEVADACIALLGDENLTVDDLIDYIPAPDFPTGATIFGLNGVREGYRTGRGRVVIRSKTHFEDIAGGREAIIVDELPYQVNKAKLCERIGELVREKAVEGISELRDESDKSGTRVVIELKRNENAEVVLNQLYKSTQLQDTFGINMVALVDGQPRLLNLKQILAEFLRHRREVVTRRTLFELKKARDRGHILEGLAVALSNVDEIIALIKASATPPEAKAALLARPWHSKLVSDMLARVEGDISAIRPQTLPENFGLHADGQYFLSEIQAQAILDMRLQRLTGLEQDKILAEYGEIMETILDLLDILDRKERVDQIIGDELTQIKAQFGDTRRSEIDPFGGGNINDEDLIPPRDMIVTLTRDGYIKTQPADDYHAQRRGGRGKQAAATKDEDFIKTLFIANTHDYLLCFSDLGRCHWVKVYKLPEGGRHSRGRPVNNVIGLEDGENITAVLAVRDFPDDEFVFFASASGGVKKVRLSAFKNVSSKGIKAVGLKEGDHLIGAARTSGQDDIMLFSDQGKAIRFNEYWQSQNGSDEEDIAEESEETADSPADEDSDNAAPPNGKYGVRPSRRGSGGSRGMRLPSGGRVVSLITFAPEHENDTGLHILTATENGYGKRTPIADYTRKNKGGQGVIAIDTGERNGTLVAAKLTRRSDDLMLVTGSGVLIRTKAAEVRETGRAAQGVRLIQLDAGEKLVDLEVLPAEEETAEENGISAQNSDTPPQDA